MKTQQVGQNCLLKHYKQGLSPNRKRIHSEEARKVHVCPQANDTYASVA